VLDLVLEVGDEAREDEALRGGRRELVLLRREEVLEESGGAGGRCAVWAGVGELEEERVLRRRDRIARSRDLGC
jgi:hypothetical protein